MRSSGPLEKMIVKQILDLLHELGYWAVKIHGGPFQTMGLPDILAMKRTPYGPKVLALEVKRPGGVPTPIQLKVLKSLGDAGAYAHVVHSVDEASLFIHHVEIDN